MSGRKIGGCFGAALGASSKRLRPDWREEIETEAEKVEKEGEGGQQGTEQDGEQNGEGTGEQNGVQGGPSGQSQSQSQSQKRAKVYSPDSDSDAVLDPGTPLQSEAEEGAEKTSAPDASASAADASNLVGQANGAAEQSVGSADGAPGVKQPSDGGAPPAAPVVEERCIVSFELLIEEVVQGTLLVLVEAGLTGALEQRLDCLQPVGAVEAMARGAFCAIAGPGPRKERREPPQASPSGTGTEGQMDAGFVGAASSGSSADPAPAAPAERYSRPGLLCAPLDGPGFLLTLGSQPELQATHLLIGHAVSGMSVLRRLDALAPLSGDLRPRKLVAFRLATGEGRSDEKDDLEVKITGQAEPAVSGAPFSMEPEPAGPHASASEELDVAELGLDRCEAEITELKLQSFSRERQQGVAAIDEELGVLASLIEKLSLEADDEVLQNRRSWLQERTRYLVRIVTKLK